MPKYVLHYASESFPNFREAEFLSILKVLSYDPDLIVLSESDFSKCVVTVEFQEESQLFRVLERSILIKQGLQLWAQAPDFNSLAKFTPQINRELLDDYLYSDNQSFKVILSTINNKLEDSARQKYISDLLDEHPAPIASAINLKSPTFRLSLIFSYEAITKILINVTYGRIVGESNRSLIMNKFSLTNRSYLGNTSMNVELATIAANLALSRPNTLIYDPFVGSGGCLIPASHFGALVYGSDIDYALLHGYDKSPKSGQGKRKIDECLMTCYKDYGLKDYFLDVIIADSAMIKHIWRNTDTRFFDAIITDPPYGVRESSRRIGKQSIEKEAKLMDPEEVLRITQGKSVGMVPNSEGLVPMLHDIPHIPHKEQYPLEETFVDLVDFSADNLKEGGRLVFWIPIHGSDLDKVDSDAALLVPSHPRLRILFMCEQFLNQRVSRFLVVMEKLKASEPDVNHNQIDNKSVEKLRGFMKRQPHARQKNDESKIKYVKTGSRNET